MRRWFVWLGMLSTVSFGATGASASTLAATVTLASPAPPQLSPTTGGSIPAHSDYVRISYVTANGETLASDESILSQPANALTVVHSPRSALGATGYNVYAIQNNGGSHTGHTLQNRSPIPIGTDYTEPATGWTQSGIVPPATSAVTVSIAWATTTYHVPASGGYFDASIPGGARAAMLLPHNDAPPGTRMGLATMPGVPSQAPGLRAVADSSLGAPALAETIRFSFNHDVTLDGYPTFKFSEAIASASPRYQVELYDGSTRALIATFQGFAYGNQAFLSNYGTPFRASRDRTYYAELVSRTATSFELTAANASKPIPMPAIGGIAGSLVLPSGTFNDIFSTSVERDRRSILAYRRLSSSATPCRA